MIPKVAKKGASFKGAGLYYLHDKDALTNDRVDFTHTENMLTNDPEKALKVMAYSAMHQDDLKARAGGSAKGRKLTQPVYSYSLAWHPDQEPTKDQMIVAAKESLEVLGLQDHETLMVAHNDEPHPHIHVIVNRVHPETGIAAKLSKDHLGLSKWAEDYERRHGQILCQQRVENNERRRNKEFVKDETIYDWRRKRLAQDYERRLNRQRNLTQDQKNRRWALYNKKEEIIENEREAIRAQTAPHWQAIYRHEKKEKDQLKHRQQNTLAHLKYILKDQSGITLRLDEEARKGVLSDYFKDISSSTIGPDPNIEKKRQDRERRAEQRARARYLKKLLNDKDTLFYDRRTGKLSGHFSDHTSRSKEDIAKDKKNEIRATRRNLISDRIRHDFNIKKSLSDPDTIRADDSDRKGKLAKAFTARAERLPPLPAKSFSRKKQADDSLTNQFNIPRPLQRSEAEQLDKKHADARKMLAGKIKVLHSSTIDQVNELYKSQLDVLREIEKEERQHLAHELSQESQERARAIREGTDFADFEQHLTNERYTAFQEMAEEITRHHEHDSDSDEFTAFSDMAEDRDHDYDHDHDDDGPDLSRKPPDDLDHD